MQSARETGFGAVLEGHLAALGAAPCLPVVVCGMAGARQGWVEAPYVAAPARFDAIAAGSIVVPHAGRTVRILPGVAERAPEKPDVMRGEETQILGLGLDAPTLVCLPGTHSKWAMADASGILGFSTFMTGEVFALLEGQSILRHSVGDAEGAAFDEGAFAQGVAEALTAPALFLNRLFALRAKGLVGTDTPGAARARLSGLVIGLEIAGARVAYPEGQSVTLVASGPMAAVYQQALKLAGYGVGLADADAAVRQGLAAAVALSGLSQDAL